MMVREVIEMRNSKSRLKACPFCGENIARLSEWNDIDGAKPKNYHVP